MGGKHRYAGQGGFYQASMNAAIVRKSRGAAWVGGLLEKLGLPLTPQQLRKYAQLERRRARQKAYHERQHVKVMRLRRKAAKKHLVFQERGETERGYGHGTALEEEEARRAARAAAGEDGEGDGGDGDEEGDGRVVASEEEDEDDVVYCERCKESAQTVDNQILLCASLDCYEAWHMRCCLPEPADPIVVDNPDFDWLCPTCEYFLYIAGDDDLPAPLV